MRGRARIGAYARPSHEVRSACDVNHGSPYGKGEIDGKRQGKRRRRGRSEARRGGQADHGAPRGGREGRLRVGKVPPLPSRHVAIPRLQRQQLPAHRDAAPRRDAGRRLPCLAGQVRQAGEEGRAWHEDPQPSRGQGESGGRRHRRSARRQRRRGGRAQACGLPPGHRVRREPDRGKGTAHLGRRRADGRRRPVRGRHARRFGGQQVPRFVRGRPGRREGVLLEVRAQAHRDPGGHVPGADPQDRHPRARAQRHARFRAEGGGNRPAGPRDSRGPGRERRLRRLELAGARHRRLQLRVRGGVERGQGPLRAEGVARRDTRRGP